MALNKLKPQIELARQFAKSGRVVVPVGGLNSKRFRNRTTVWFCSGKLQQNPSGRFFGIRSNLATAMAPQARTPGAKNEFLNAGSWQDNTELSVGRE